jgi:rod shape-determining protein MreD
MAINVRFFKEGLLRAIPLLALVYICISEFHTQFYLWDIFSFNIQFIIIYYWILRDPSILGYGFVFLCGLINDVVLSLPLGTSPLAYLFVSLVAAYVRNATVRSTLFTDWFTFIIAVLVGNFIVYFLLNNFSEFSVDYGSLFFNSLFTFILYPAFWGIFELYRRYINLRIYD